MTSNPLKLPVIAKPIILPWQIPISLIFLAVSLSVAPLPTASSIRRILSCLLQENDGHSLYDQANVPNILGTRNWFNQASFTLCQTSPVNPTLLNSVFGGKVKWCTWSLVTYNFVYMFLVVSLGQIMRNFWTVCGFLWWKSFWNWLVLRK